MHRSRLIAIGVITVMVSSTTHAGRAQNSGTPESGRRANAAMPRSVDGDDRAAVIRRPGTGLTGTVQGTAWRGDTTPLPQARIRLRNIQTGRGVAVAVTNSDGRFRFDLVEPGSYVVELLSANDKVIAVGDLFGVSADMQSITFVRLSAKSPWFAGFFGNAAAAAIAAASTIGVTATGSNGRPASPQ
jgi:hypothetical protein